MPIEIACGNCGNSFGVEAGWAGLIVQCPFCQATVQVPDEVADFVEDPAPTSASSPTTFTQPDEPAAPPPIPAVDRTATPSKERGPTPAKSAPSSDRPTHRSDRPNPSSARRPTSPSASNTTANRRPPTDVKKVERSRTVRQEPDLADTQPVILETAPPASAAGSQAQSPISQNEVGRVEASQPTEASLAESLPTLPLPAWTVPPICEWLQESASGTAIRVVAREGVTTINYHGQKMILRDQPEAVNWYGRIVFVLSVVALAVLLTWLYYIYR
jgi:hypothetical protein